MNAHKNMCLNKREMLKRANAQMILLHPCINYVLFDVRPVALKTNNGLLLVEGRKNIFFEYEYTNLQKGSQVKRPISKKPINLF